MHLLVLLILATPLLAAELVRDPLLPPGITFAVAIGGPLAVVVWAWILLRGSGGLRGGRRSGLDQPSSIRRRERALGLLQWATLIPHGVACLAGGLPMRLRAALGDHLLVDEIVAIAPPLLAIVAIWVLWSPVEMALRECATIDRFDRGLMPARTPGRSELVLTHVRTRILLVLVPALLALGLIDGARRVLGSVEPAWLVDAAQFAAVPIVLLASPWIARLVLDAVPMPPGALRDRLLEVAWVHRVRIGTLLVWRTGLSMHNGAVVGVIPGARCVLLTDALLEDLPEPELVAVMAHEVAHLRCRHLLVAALALIGSGALLALILERLTWGVASELRVDLEQHAAIWAEGSAMIGAVLGVLLIFGWVSRRLERQADTFAVRHLSGRVGGDGDAGRVTEEAVQTMCRALDSVAGPSGIDPSRHSWRHGSIAWRQRYLRSLVGLPLDGLPIDRQVRWIVMGSLAGLAAAVLADPAAWMPR